MKSLTFGIIGCGTIGGGLARKLAKGGIVPVKCVYCADIDVATAKTLVQKCGRKAVVATVDQAIAQSDFLIEASATGVSYELALKCLAQHKSIMIMSVGGLLKNTPALLKAAAHSRGRVYVPSGALCGVDGLLAACADKVTKVTLRTTKPVAGLRGAPYFETKAGARFDLDRLKKETVVFSGTAAQATKYFPKNINVAAVLSLAGIGTQRTRVEIVVSPQGERNTHEVIVEGAFGRLRTLSENVPAPGNPRTSFMAVLAAEALLKKIFAPVAIGT